MGTPDFSVPILEILASAASVVAVVTQTDKPAGRGKQIRYSSVKEIALRLELPVLQPEKLTEEKFVNKLKKLNPDFIVVAAYGKILPKFILELPHYGCINVHASLLPRWRGASPIRAAILHGDRKTGVTIMQMDEGLDTGDILAQSTIEIGKTDTAGTLSQKISVLAADLLLKTLSACISGEIEPMPQDDQIATYAKMIHKADGLIDFENDAEFIERKIRAFNPWPVCYMEWKDQRLRIFNAEVSETKNFSPWVRGVVRKYPAVGTKTKDLILKAVQPSGKRLMSGKAFLNGIKDWSSQEKDVE